jgi:4-oxalocrotonate tautomerase family enzyme
VPVAHFYLTSCTDDQQARILQEGSARYAALLQAPMDRVRVFVHRHPATGMATAGRAVSETGLHAPFVTALVLQGRPVDLRHRLIAELTDLVVEVLDVDRALVRVHVTEVDPDGWGIGGIAAAVVRRDEIAARSQESSRTDG